MDLQRALPIRLAASASHEESTATPETPNPPAIAAAAAPGPAPGPLPSLSLSPLNADALSPFSLVAGGRVPGASANYAPTGFSPNSRVLAATGPNNHQFWLKDAKVAEELFTIHRSAQDLVNFAASLIGNHDDPVMGHRPIPVMSDDDVLFMTQLSQDIVRSINGITGIRQHGTRMRRRKIKHGHPAPPRDYSAYRSRGSRASHEVTVASGGGGSKRLRKSIEDDQLQQCYKCGRKETPEWRKGPDGLLCNSCGLVYAKQRRKQKLADKAEKSEQAGTR